MRRHRWLIAAAAAGAAVLLAVAGLQFWRARTVSDRDQWIQLTSLPDSVVQPTLSPDGRMLAFIRGTATFQTVGQVYVKVLPDGEPKQLTQDDLQKDSPAFSPDGSQIAYTTINSQFDWDTWRVPVLGGTPTRWFPNASGLVWIDRQRVLFSEKREGIHMAVVTADATRAGERDVFVPAHERGMGHRSYPSPDRTRALIVEMDATGEFAPCRLVPMDGSSAGRPVGPPKNSCKSAGWSPDGQWMYLTSGAGGGYHIWRQRFPDGQPEQITAGPTQEEGVAVAPDGRSIVSAVGLVQRSVMLHNAEGDRPVSLEGYAFNPRVTPDGKRICYLILKSAEVTTGRSELWVADVDSGRSELLVPNVANTRDIRAYDLSPDGRQVVFVAADAEGRFRLWLMPLDRSAAPHQIPGVEGHQPTFGLQGEILFRAVEGNQGFAYRVQENGTERRKVIAQSVITLYNLSPDGRWLAAWGVLSSAGASGTALFPVDGGSPVRIWGSAAVVQWSHDNRFLLVSLTPLQKGQTYLIPLTTVACCRIFPPRASGRGTRSPGCPASRLSTAGTSCSVRHRACTRSRARRRSGTCTASPCLEPVSGGQPRAAREAGCPDRTTRAFHESSRSGVASAHRQPNSRRLRMRAYAHI